MRAAQPREPLRLWPGVIAVVLQWLVRFGLPIVMPAATFFGVIGGLVAGLAIIVWWVFFSRAAWSDRVGAIGVMIVGLFATSQIAHESIATGMTGLLFFIYATPVVCLAFVAWAVASRRMASGRRRTSMVVAILLACGVMTLFRTEGITGDADSDFEWRWTPTSEERLLAQADDPVLPPVPAAAAAPERPLAARPSGEASAASAPPVVTTSHESLAARTLEDPDVLLSTSAAAEKPAGWSGFRGPDRDGVIRGVRIETDWSVSPPVQLWRRPIGPGWSSFAVRGNLLYTQEQRGDDEVVSSYSMTTGEPVWRHRDPARFWESNGGAGPRATPTLSDDRVYTFGATGILNALDARSGSLVWSRNAASDTGVKVPDWGFASSPLVVGDIVIVAAAGSLAAYDITTGRPLWFGPKGGWGYSSPHFSTIGGVTQILLLNGSGAISVAPAYGALLWQHAWQSDGIVQPAVTAEGDVLLGTGAGIGIGSGTGVRRVAVAHGSGGWTVEERWTSAGLKPYYNDFVVHGGHAFGFDGSILACIDLNDGTRKWKGGRYGNGQVVLLPEQDLLMVLSEQGELALVAAASDKFTELSRFKAIEGKTWNHPVLIGDVLLVRNGEEMAAFRLPRARR